MEMKINTIFNQFKQRIFINHILSSIMRISFILIFSFSTNSNCTKTVKKQEKKFSPCLASSVEFNNTSINKIFFEPDEVLEDPRSFWKREIPYNRTIRWAEWSLVDIDYLKFEKIVRVLSKWPEKKRRGHKFLKFSDRLIGDGDGNIIIDVSSKKWKQDTGWVLNLIIHEIYHLGYVRHNPGISLKKAMDDEDFMENILWQVQNEGMATWVAYKGRNIFPIYETERDYEMLESDKDIDRLFGEVNSLIRTVKKNQSQKTQKLVWKVGVKSRGFYIVGAFMAKTLEEKKGNDYLLKMIKLGPLNFALEYNKVAASKKRMLGL